MEMPPLTLDLTYLIIICTNSAAILTLSLTLHPVTSYSHGGTSNRVHGVDIIPRYIMLKIYLGVPHEKIIPRVHPIPYQVYSYGTPGYDLYPQNTVCLS